MRRPVSTCAGELACEGSVLVGVVAGVVVPAAPEDAQPGGAEGADGALVVVAAVAGVGVDLVRPGVPVAGAVGEGVDGVAAGVCRRRGGSRRFCVCRIRWRRGFGRRRRAWRRRWGSGCVGRRARRCRVAGQIAVLWSRKSGRKIWPSGWVSDGAVDLAGELADLVDESVAGRLISPSTVARRASVSSSPARPVGAARSLARIRSGVWRPQ